MGIQKITERQVIGTFHAVLNDDSGAAWIDKISNYFTSDQNSEEYAWIGQSPVMREWIGGRNAKGFTENNLTINNKHFETTIEVLVKDLRRDKSGQVMTRIQDMARRTNSHWATLLSALIIGGESTACYDNQFFFDTDHSEGDSGAQSNDLSVDISGLPILTAGTTTAPAVAEMQFAIANGIQQIMSYVDNQGEPMNSDASEFMVMVPVSFMNTALQAVATPAQVAETQSALAAMKGQFGLSVVVNPRLTWTTKMVIFRTDSYLKSFIRQEETGVSLKIKGYGSEYEFDNDAHQYGVDTWRNVGYGYWQNSCLVTLA